MTTKQVTIEKPTNQQLVPIDLHSHSTHSDGRLSIEELLNLAKANGCQHLAVTDHDTVSGIAAAKIHAKNLSLNLITGVEISVTWDKELIHILGLNIDEHDASLINNLASLQNQRITRGKMIAAKLAALGIHDAFAGAMAYCKEPQLKTLSRNHFARFLVEHGYTKPGTAFSTYLAPGKPAYVAFTWAKLEDAVSWITNSGGVAVIAHPCRYKLKPQRLTRLIDQFKESGGLGIEVVSSSHNKEDVMYIARLAQQHQLLASNGSDFHGNTHSNQQPLLGLTIAIPDRCEPIYSALQIAID